MLKRQNRIRYGLMACALLSLPSLQAQDFGGWEQMRVIHQENQPQRLVAADLDASGRETLIVINTRQCRLDLYRWLPPEKRLPVSVNSQDPNELPMAPDWEKKELLLENPPRDLAVIDLDGKPQLLIVSATSNKAQLYKASPEGVWKSVQSWDLLAGNLTERAQSILVRKNENSLPEALLNFDQGIQVLPLTPNSRPRWLRDSTERLAWRLVDLDGDGQLDLLEWTAQARQTLRWSRNVAGRLQPAQPLYDKPIQAMEVLSRPGRGAEIFLLGGEQPGLLRRYRLGHGPAGPVGTQWSFTLAGKGHWQSMQLESQPALLRVDPTQPKLQLNRFSGEVWGPEEIFPFPSQVQAMARTGDGSLLLWTKDAAELQITRWAGGRFSYPETWRAETPDAKPDASAGRIERKILALSSVGNLTWWAQKSGSDLELYLWPKDQEQPQRLKFAALGAKVDKILWLGGQRIVYQNQYAESAKIAELQNQQVVISEPATPIKLDRGGLELFTIPGESEPRLGRYSEGALQWLGANLQPREQIMLSDNQRLESYVALEKTTGWALQEGGRFLHRLQTSNSGMAGISESYPLAGGAQLTIDANLGLMVEEAGRLTQLSQGAPWELQLLQSIEAKTGRSASLKTPAIDRLLAADLITAGTPALLLVDDSAHQLTAWGHMAEKFEPLISWPVFEDKAYPYGGGEHSGRHIGEPRQVVAFSARGSKRRDLAMLCQDRLLIYLSESAR